MPNLPMQSVARAETLFSNQICNWQRHFSLNYRLKFYLISNIYKLPFEIVFGIRYFEIVQKIGYPLISTN